MAARVQAAGVLPLAPTATVRGARLIPATGQQPGGNPGAAHQLNPMHQGLILLTVAATGLLACEQGRNTTPATAEPKPVDSATHTRRKKPLPTRAATFVHTRYVYPDAKGGRLLIQNSFPKSKIHYIAPDGRHYVYAVFWTRLTNQTAAPLTLTLAFPADSVEIPAASGNYLRLLVPTDTLTRSQEPLADYGLNAKAFLDQHRHTASSLTRTIQPGDSSAFYVVPLSNRGVGGTLRTGLRLQGQTLFYRVNDQEIACGRIKQ